jgi:hypothetical protein
VVFACELDRECPDRFNCVDQRCVSFAELDAGHDKADDPDAPDASIGPDAALTPVTLSQSNSDQIVDGNTTACKDPDLFNVHDDNHYFRVFDLSGEDFAGDLHVNRVEFAIELAATGGSQTVTVRIHQLDGALLFGNLTLLGEREVTVADQALSILAVDLDATVPGGTTFAVEVFIPRSGGTFFIGSNSAGESGLSYLAAPSCDTPEPITLASFPPPATHVILRVLGAFEG